ARDGEIDSSAATEAARKYKIDEVQAASGQGSDAGEAT
ncbi:MAG: hypothetical protein QOH74_408, partial [Gaiellales bacterium]|nr:hypothetical protein [Gaiellales bacterium]